MIKARILAGAVVAAAAPVLLSAQGAMAATTAVPCPPTATYSTGTVALVGAPTLLGGLGLGLDLGLGLGLGLDANALVSGVVVAAPHVALGVRANLRPRVLLYTR